MKRKIITLVALLLAGFACADVNVNPDKVLGPIKPMNGVNNGPGGPYGLGNSQIRDNFDDYKAAKIPFARTHDAAFSECYGSGLIDFLFLVGVVFKGSSIKQFFIVEL